MVERKTVSSIVFAFPLVCLQDMSGSARRIDWRRARVGKSLPGSVLFPAFQVPAGDSLRGNSITKVAP